MKGFKARHALFNLCIDRNWYTGGDCAEYERMLTFVEEIECITDDGITAVAMDICFHTPELNPYKNGDIQKVVSDLYANVF